MPRNQTNESYTKKTQYILDAIEKTYYKLGYTEQKIKTCLCIKKVKQTFEKDNFYVVMFENDKFYYLMDLNFFLFRPLVDWMPSVFKTTKKNVYRLCFYLHLQHFKVKFKMI